MIRREFLKSVGMAMVMPELTSNQRPKHPTISVNGKIVDVRIYDKSLSADEVLELEGSVILHGIDRPFLSGKPCDIELAQ